MIITVVLEALTGSFNTDINRSAKQAERDLKRMEAEVSRAFKKFASVASTAALAVAAALAVIGKNAINNADQLGKLSQKVGIAVEDLSKLAYAAQLNNVGLDELQLALVRLGDAAVEAQSGTGNAAEAFRALGVDIRDGEKNLKSNYQLLLDTADATAKYADGAGKGAALTDIFGKSAANLIPLMNGGRAAIKDAGDELEQFGGLITKETARAAGQFNDNLTRLGKAFNALAAQISAELLDDLIRITDQFIEFVKNGPAIEETLKKIASATNTLAAALGAIAGARIGATLGPLGALVGAGLGGLAGFGLAKNLTASTEARLEGLRKQLERLESQRATIEEFGGGITEFQLGEINRLKSEIAALEKTVEAVSTEAPNQAEDTRPSLLYDPNADEAAKKALDSAKKAAAEARRFQEALAQGATEIFQAQQERERSALEASLDLRLVSYRDYLAERLRLTEAAIDQEIAASQALLQGAEADEAVLLQARIESLEIRREIARDEAAQDEARHVREIALDYDDAAASARSYLDVITREGQRTLASFDQTPSERRRSAGQFQIDDRFIAQQEQLDRELAAGGLTQADYDQRLTLLQNSHAAELAEWTKYFDAIEAKQKDFTTSFNNVVQEYVDQTSNVGQALAETFVSAIDEAINSTSRLAAEFILFGEGGKDAIYNLARSIATELLQALIRVGIQLLINKTLLKTSTSPSGLGAGGGIYGALFSVGSSIGQGFAIGGYTGDDPRNRVTGVVHGQEFVVNADATRKNRDILEAINDGTYADNATMIPRTSSQGKLSPMTQRIINVWDKSDIKDYLMGSEGDDVFINWAGRNSSRLKSIVAS